MPAIEDDILRIYDEQGRKRPYTEFREDAERLEWRPDQQIRFIHQQRSRRAQIADQSFRAVDTREMPTGAITSTEKLAASRTVQAYYEQPNRIDIEGIDTTAEEYKQRRVRRVSEAYLEGNLIGAVREKTPGQMAEADAQIRGASGAYVRGLNPASESGRPEILLSKKAAGRESVLAHELGHALDDRLASTSRAFSDAAIEDDLYAEQVREATVERRGQFDDTFDTYRAEPTEQFADWFVGAIEEPRHTRATRGAPWEAIEEQAAERTASRIDELEELPRKTASREIRYAVDRILGEREDYDYTSDEAREVTNLIDEAQRGVRLRYETEGHRERVESRIRDLEDDLKDARISNVADFARLPIGDVWVDDDPLFEGSRKADLIPEEPIRKLEDRLGEPLNIAGL